LYFHRLYLHRRPSRPPLRTLQQLRLRYLHFPTNSQCPLPLSPTAHLTPRRRCQSRHRSRHGDHTIPHASFAHIDSRPRFFSRSLVHLFIRLPDRNSGFIMSICFTICPSVSLLPLVFKYCSSRHDGATHIVSMFHAQLCTRLILFFRHHHFFHLLAAAPLHIYDHLFFLGLVCALSIWSYFFVLCSFVFHLSPDHGTYKLKPTSRHDITLALLAFLFLSLCCFCLY
jgi:hypothetical protein